MLDQRLLWASGVVLMVGAAIGLYFWQRRKKEPDIRRALDAIAIERLERVLVPDGMGGHIQVEHLLLTARGILLIEAKSINGAVFASDRMDEWTVIGKQGRYVFPNPQGTLYDRVAAVRQLLRHVPVTGYVLFPPGADFSKGKPKDVMLSDELGEEYKKPDRAETERLREAFWPHWEQLCETVLPADAGRPLR